MRTLILAAAALALVGAPAYAAPKKTANTPAAANTTAPAATPKKSKKTKAAPAATPAAPAAKPAPAPMMAMKPSTPAAVPAKAAPAPMTAMKPATTASTAKPATAQGNKMKACASQWDGLSADQKAAYKTKATGQKGKSGKALSGYNVFSSECLKK